MSAWGAPSSSAFPIGYNSDPDTLAHTAGTDRTVRMVVRPTAAGTAVKLRLTNALSTAPLQVGAVRVARSTGGATTRGPGRVVRFGGSGSTSLAAGATRLSDAVRIGVRPGHDLTVSIHLVGPAANPSVHSQAFQDTYVSADGSGDRTAESGARSYPTTIGSFVALDRLDVRAPRTTRGVVVLGDSLSDGIGSTYGAHDRWTDVLARRLHHRRVPLSVVDEGLSGNSLACPVGLPQDGPTGLSRLRRDVLSAAGVGVLWVFEGTNDLANFCTAASVQDALTRVVALAHRHEIRVVASTLIPRVDLHFPASAERERQRYNHWLRSPDAPVDAVVDFDAAVRGPDGGWDPAYDSGDQVHLNPAGYRVLGRRVRLGLLQRLAAA